MSDLKKYNWIKLKNHTNSKHIVQLIELVLVNDTFLPKDIEKISTHPFRQLSTGRICRCVLQIILKTLYVPDVGVLTNPEPGDTVYSVPISQIYSIWVTYLSLLCMTLLDAGIIVKVTDSKISTEYTEDIKDVFKALASNNNWEKNVIEIAQHKCVCDGTSLVALSQDSLPYKPTKSKKSNTKIESKKGPVRTTTITPKTPTPLPILGIPSNTPVHSGEDPDISQSSAVYPSLQEELDDIANAEHYALSAQFNISTTLKDFLYNNNGLSLKDIYTDPTFSLQYFTALGEMLPSRYSQFKSLLTQDVIAESPKLFPTQLAGDLINLPEQNQSTDNLIYLTGDLFFKLGYKTAKLAMAKTSSGDETLKQLLKDSINVNTENMNLILKSKAHITDTTQHTKLDTILNQLKSISITVDNLAKIGGIQGKGAIPATTTTPPIGTIGTLPTNVRGLVTSNPTGTISGIGIQPLGTHIGQTGIGTLPGTSTQRLQSSNVGLSPANNIGSVSTNPKIPQVKGGVMRM